jgi:hypothetical protein
MQSWGPRRWGLGIALGMHELPLLSATRFGSGLELVLLLYVFSSLWLMQL